MLTIRGTFSRPSRHALVSACYEYLLVTAPVAIYVSLEAVHKHDMTFAWSSPEWAIATIFLLFQGVALYRRDLHRTGRPLAEASFGLLELLALLLTVTALLNAYVSLGTNTLGVISFRLALFFVVSLAFILLVTSARLVYLTGGSHAHG